MNENELDRHFASQIRKMHDVHTATINQTTWQMTLLWLEVFQGASSSEKYARNCLMLMMYSQLKDLGKLCQPFDDLSNQKRPLSVLLEEYQSSGRKEDHLDQKLDSKVGTAPLGDTSCSTCGDCIEAISQERNRHLIDEVRKLHESTKRQEQYYKQKESHWQQQLQQCSQAQQQLQPMRPARQEQLLRLERSANLAIRKLRQWTPMSEPVSLFSMSLTDVLTADPSTKQCLLELDRQLEQVLQYLLEQAGERRANNLRIVYEQKELLKEKTNPPQTEQQPAQSCRCLLCRAGHESPSNGSKALLEELRTHSCMHCEHLTEQHKQELLESLQD